MANARRGAIARAFTARPSILLCNEMTSALDVSVKASVLHLIRDPTRSQEGAVLFITHNIAATAGPLTYSAKTKCPNLTSISDPDTIWGFSPNIPRSCQSPIYGCRLKNPNSQRLLVLFRLSSQNVKARLKDWLIAQSGEHSSIGPSATISRIKGNFSRSDRFVALLGLF
jgi:hypothetical protein